MTYRAESGSVNALSMGTSLATAGADFFAGELTVTLEDNQQSAVISVPISNVRIHTHNIG